MDIVTLSFEKPLNLTIKGQTVTVIMFKTLEYGNIKFGIEAPKNVKVNREEVYQAIRQKALSNTADSS